MKDLLKSRNLILINFIIITYFALLWLVNFYQLDFVFIGVFKELLTIPFLVTQLFFLIIGVIHLIKYDNNHLMIVSLILLAASTAYTVGSFFVN